MPNFVDDMLPLAGPKVQRDPVAEGEEDYMLSADDYNGMRQGMYDMRGKIIALSEGPTAGSLYRNVTADPYNAVGDFAADDTAAIQAAIDAVHAAGGGVVYLPNGTYRVTRQSSSPAECLLLKSNVTLLGEGPGAILKLGDNEGDAARIIVTERPTLVFADRTFAAEEIEIEEVDTFLVTIEDHDLETGDGPLVPSNSGGALPTGLTAATNYWAIKYDDDHLMLALSLSDALTRRPVVITDAGTGTHTLSDGVDCVRPSHDMALRNFSIDGNKQNNDVDEHKHGIFVFDAHHITFENLDIRNCCGDGVAFSGGQDCTLRNVHAHECERTGIDFIGFGSHRVTVSECSGVGNRDGFHIELSDLVQCTDITVENTYCGRPHLFAGLGLSVSSPVDRLTLHNVTVGGPMSFALTTNSLIEKCSMKATEEDWPAPLAIGGGCHDLTVRDCKIELAVTPALAQQIVTIGGNAADEDFWTYNITLENNTYISEAANCVGFSIIDAWDVTVRGGRLEGPLGNTQAAFDLFAVTPATPSRSQGNVRFEGVRFVNWGVAGVVAVSHPDAPITGLYLIDNVFESVAASWHMYPNNGGPTKVVVRGNTSLDGAPQWSLYPPSPVLVGGDFGAGGVYSCDGSPEGVIEDVGGAVAYRRDGKGVMYVKETEAYGDTGWIAVGARAGGYIACAAKAVYVDGDYMTIPDNIVGTKIYEFDVAGDGVTGGRIQVNISTDTTKEDVAARLRTAILANQITLDVEDLDDGLLRVSNKIAGRIGDVTITENVATPEHGVSGMDDEEEPAEPITWYVDPTSDAAMPLNQTQWENWRIYVGLNQIAIPDSIFLMDEAAGNLADVGVGARTFTKTGAAATYENPVTGWDTVGVELPDNSAADYFSFAGANLSTTSVAAFAIVALNTLAARGLIMLGGSSNADETEINIDAAGHIVVRRGANTATSTATYSGVIGILAVLRPASSIFDVHVQAAGGALETIAPTWEMPPNATHSVAIGKSFNHNAADATFMRFEYWEGVNADEFFGLRIPNFFDARGF